MELKEVLHSVGLSAEHHANYLDLLRRAGGERLTYCDSAFDGTYAEVLVFRSGIVPAGCMARIRWDAQQGSSTEAHRNTTQTITPLADGWRLIYECT